MLTLPLTCPECHGTGGPLWEDDTCCRWCDGEGVVTARVAAEHDAHRRAEMGRGVEVETEEVPF
jgi:DnaJ-class molecular chaperone